MTSNWYLIFAGALVEAFVVSLALTGLMRWVSHRWGAVQTARVLVHCDAHAIPGANVAASELVQAIEAEQENDGGWLDLSDPSVTARVARTLDAMAALMHFTGQPGRS